MMFEELGPIFVKLGQVISTRKDLLTDDIANELSKLQDNVKPFPKDISMQIIENELKAYSENVFNKDQIVVFTKCDAFSENKLNDIKNNINGINVKNAFFISSVTGLNIDSLCRKVIDLIDNEKDKDHNNFDQKSLTWEP